MRTFLKIAAFAAVLANGGAAFAAEPSSDTAAVNGQKAIADARKALDELDTVREAARTTVLAGMSGLIKNLEAKLGPMDPRWLAFGLHKPGAYVSPAKPTGLTLTLIGSDAVLSPGCEYGRTAGHDPASPAR